jgi:hypothetical protein
VTNIVEVRLHKGRSDGGGGGGLWLGAKMVREIVT